MAEDADEILSESECNGNCDKNPSRVWRIKEQDKQTVCGEEIFHTFHKGVFVRVVAINKNGRVAMNSSVCELV